MGPVVLSTSPSRKRLAIRLGIVATLLLVVCVPVAWRYRPLNGLEQRLVGGWIQDSGRQDWNVYHTLTFTADRRYIREITTRGDTLVDEAGSWSASSGMLRLVTDTTPPRSWWDRLVWRFQRFFRRNLVAAASVDFDMPSTFRTSLYTNQVRPWTRLPAESDSK